MSNLKSITSIVTENTTLSKKEGSISHARTLGATSLSVREFDRGTDLQIFDRSAIDSGVFM